MLDGGGMDPDGLTAPALPLTQPSLFIHRHQISIKIDAVSTIAEVRVEVRFVIGDFFQSHDKVVDVFVDVLIHPELVVAPIKTDVGLTIGDATHLQKRIGHFQLNARFTGIHF